MKTGSKQTNARPLRRQVLNISLDSFNFGTSRLKTLERLRMISTEVVVCRVVSFKIYPQKVARFGGCARFAGSAGVSPASDREARKATADTCNNRNYVLTQRCGRDALAPSSSLVWNPSFLVSLSYQI